MTETSLNLPEIIAKELTVPQSGVQRALALLDEGATVPFLARYRKEVTGGLDEVQLATIRDRAELLRDLDKRRRTILASIEEQGKLTPELKARIAAAATSTELEDLYLPYRPKRRTRATMAKERGLEPLADLIWEQQDALPEAAEAIAARYVDPEKEVADVEAAWQGARDICAERIAEQPELRAELRELAMAEGEFESTKARERKEKPVPDLHKFEDYFEFRERVETLPSHRILAILRGENIGALWASLELNEDRALGAVRRRVVRNRTAALSGQLELAMTDAYGRLLSPAIETDIRRALRERAETDAIRVFSDNLRQLLMGAPFGAKRVLALDPGFRSGCKLVVLDETGALLEDTVIYPHEPQRQEKQARARVAELAQRHKVSVLAIGNGTAGRETMAFATAMKRAGELPTGCTVASVNESGASIYSASEVARKELPDKDVTVRGAVSIGRRLQDPLAELVKIDPKSIGVGQYQHDVNQRALKKSLDGVVEICVNRVGVEVNTASASLLSYVAGIGETLATNIVNYRDENGHFRTRAAIKKVPRLGARAFEQAAGFLRVRESAHPLDRTAVHPESYAVVGQMAKDLGVEVTELIGNAELLGRVEVARYIDGERGEPTVRDILAELDKPGRDPRDTYEEVGFRDDVTELSHLKPGMRLAGVVTNVTSFGAFVDVGVHQDGLVHISQLADRFVKDPADVVKVGDRVKVTVMLVETDRKRIGLSMKSDAHPDASAAGTGGKQRSGGKQDSRARRGRDSAPTGFNTIQIPGMKPS